MSPPPPATWTLGPQRRYPNLTAPILPWAIDMQLFNLLPGDHWDPLLEANLLTKRRLVTQATKGSWRFRNDDFAWLLHFYPLAIHIQVNHRPTATQAFLFYFQTLVARKTDNDILDPTGRYAYSGSVVYSWIGRP